MQLMNAATEKFDANVTAKRLRQYTSTPWQNSRSAESALDGVGYRIRGWFVRVVPVFDILNRIDDSRSI